MHLLRLHLYKIYELNRMATHGTAPRLPTALFTRVATRKWVNAQTQRIKKEEQTSANRLRNWTNAQKNRINREAAEETRRRVFEERMKIKKLKRAVHQLIVSRRKRGHTVLKMGGGKNRTRKNRH